MTKNASCITKRPLMVRSAALSLALVANFVFATVGLAGTQADDPDLPQPMVERMINELLDRLSASAEQIEQDRSVA